MKKVLLKDLVGKKVAGIKANVTRQGGEHHYDYQDAETIRTLEKVYFRKIKGINWLYWTWEPAPHHNGMPDCGYSGIAESERHPLNTAYIYIEA